MDQTEGLILVGFLTLVVLVVCVCDWHRRRVSERRMRYELEEEMDRAFAHAGWQDASTLS